MKITMKNYLGAIRTLTGDGFQKQAFGSRGGPRCMLGHMKAALGAPDDGLNPEHLGYTIAEAMGFSSAEIIRFNDDIETTSSDVKTFLAFGAAGMFDSLVDS